MDRSELIELLARRLYECRHKGCDSQGRPFPTWEELQLVKTYKRRKYRDLAGAAIDALIERGLLTM